MIVIAIGRDRNHKPFIKFKRELQDTLRGKLNIKALFESNYSINTLLESVRGSIFADESKSEEYEKRYTNIKQNHNNIKVLKITTYSIGEMLVRYFYAVEECFKDNNTLYVLLPELCWLGNYTTANVQANKYIGICDIEDTLFWLYIIKHHESEIDLSEMGRLSIRKGMPTYYVKANSIVDHFTESERDFGNKSMKDMGIINEYVCFASRNSIFKTKVEGRDNDDASVIRNSRFDYYKKSIEYLESVKIQAVKMGRGESPMVPINNCIDYAGKFANDFMDLFLSANCMFMVSGISGIFNIPQIFSKPVLVVNAIFITFSFGGCRYTEFDMFIPKKYYNKHKNRCLSFKEILELEKSCHTNAQYYRKKGIEFIENTEEEILEAVKEMYSRLKGTWVDTTKDFDNYNEYKEIYKEIYNEQHKNPKNGNGDPLPFRPAATYLRKNQYLLE